MKLAITGANGRVGKRVVALALKQGHTVVAIDNLSLPQPQPELLGIHEYSFLQADLRDYAETLKALKDCQGVVHLAGIPNPADYRVSTHNTNVVISWNVIRASAELGITRIAQASSVNVITMVYSQRPQFSYFPIDEDHPCLPDEPYGLSKLICEIQADSIIRRYPAMRIASLRLGWSIPNRAHAKDRVMERAKNDLWGYVQEDSAAEAFLLAVTGETGEWSGHERFFITAPDTTVDVEVEVLREKYWPDVPIKDGKGMSGKQGFFDCSKAERLLHWVHRSLESV